MKEFTFLDTETTGLEAMLGHRIIQLGMVTATAASKVSDKVLMYFDPEREVDPGSTTVHGITREMLQGQPSFRLMAQQIADYLRNRTLVIHNAPFDVGFLDMEFVRAEVDFVVSKHCEIIDSVILVRKKWPGQRASLNAACERLGISTDHRDMHGALLDATLLKDMYFSMQAGQSNLDLSQNDLATSGRFAELAATYADRPLSVTAPSESEMAAHSSRMADIAKVSKKQVWDGPTLG